MSWCHELEVVALLVVGPIQPRRAKKSAGALVMKPAVDLDVPR